LEGSGYQTTPLDAPPTGVVDELIEGADLLLVVPRLHQGVRESFLGAMGKSNPRLSQMPVIALTTAVEESPQEEERVQSVPWPSETKVLVERIEAALSTSAPSSAPTTQADTG